MLPKFPTFLTHAVDNHNTSAFELTHRSKEGAHVVGGRLHHQDGSLEVRLTCPHSRAVGKMDERCSTTYGNRMVKLDSVLDSKEVRSKISSGDKPSVHLPTATMHNAQLSAMAEAQRADAKRMDRIQKAAVDYKGVSDLVMQHLTSREKM